ncbi:MAG: hypothetical protein ABIB41_00790 [Nitrospirota bacterium]
MPKDFVDRYLQRIMISGKIDINSIPADDLHFLLNHLLEREGICHDLSKAEDRNVALSLFRDKIIGVPYDQYILGKNRLKDRFKKECDKWYKGIEVLIKKNCSEMDNLKSDTLLDNHRKDEKIARLKKNIKELNAIKHNIISMKQKPDLHILQALLPDSNLRDNIFGRSFNFIRFGLNELDSQYLDFPLRWCGFLPSDEFNRLLREWKQGKDIINYVVDSFHDKDIKDFIYAQINRSSINVIRKQIILEAIRCFYEKKYSSSIILLLPQIEGLLWDLAEQFNNDGKFIYKTSDESSSAYGSFSFKIDKNQGLYYVNNGLTKHYTEVEQKDLSILSLRQNEKGEMIKIEDIGTLLKETAFRFYVYIDFIEYFCNELYAQRNEILHGRDLDFETVENAVKKNLALLMILYYFNEIE